MDSREFLFVEASSVQCRWHDQFSEQKRFALSTVQVQCPALTDCIIKKLLFLPRWQSIAHVALQ